MNLFQRSLAIAASTAVAASALAAGPTTPRQPTPSPLAWDGVVRGELTPDGAQGLAPYDLARAALVAQAGRLGVNPEDFAFDHVTHSSIGLHVRGAEYRGGVAVLGTSAAVHVVDGRVWQVEARGSELPGTATHAAIAGSTAQDVALDHLGLASATDGLWVAVDRHLVERDGRLADLWRVHVTSLTGISGTVLVSATDATVLGVEDDRRFADGTAEVFDPNPVVFHQDPTLRQPGVDFAGVDTDLPDARLDEARVTLPMLEVNVPALSQARLVGPWVDVRAAAPLAAGIESELSFDFGREDPRFEAVMGYAHLDRAQRYFQDVLGLTGVNDESQLLIAVPVPGFDNSFYQPANDLMLLGSGGVDDGEDAEVILHEYGHAVHDAQVPGWGRTPEGGAMGEGFGDFLAAAFYARTSSRGFQDHCLMDWDATSYDPDGEPPCLRRTDTGKRWPDDRAGQVHADGEVWSQFLWNVRKRMATGTGADAERVRSDRSLRLLLTSHTFLTPTATFEDASLALQSAAVALGDREAERIVTEEAKRIGFL